MGLKLTFKKSAIYWFNIKECMFVAPIRVMCNGGKYIFASSKNKNSIYNFLSKGVEL